MSKIKACFIKEGKTYIEKNLTELHIVGTKVLEYPDRCFYYFNGYLMEVSPTDQKELFKEKNHNKYVKRKNEKVKTVSLDILIADDVKGYEILVDPNDYAYIVMRKVMGEIAMKEVESLPPDENDLIVNIVINKMSERDYANKIGVHYMTIHSRKNRILKQLKNKLEKN